MVFDVKDTTFVQAESLLSFMAMLGYVPHRENGGFITNVNFLSDKRVISTRTAINLHNLLKEDWEEVSVIGEDGSVGLFVTPKETTAVPGFFQLSPEGLDMVLLTKLVEKVKFIPNKKAQNGFTVYEHWIKVAHEELKPLLQQYIEDPQSPLAP